MKLLSLCVVFVPTVFALDGVSTYVGLTHSTGARLMSKDVTRFPDRVTMTLSLADGKQLKLVRTEHLFAPSYKAERRGINDTLHSVVHPGPPAENCWYHAEEPGEMAAISLCNGVQGLWWIGDYQGRKNRVLWVEPEHGPMASIIKVQDVHATVHRTFDVTDTDAGQDLRCGTTDMGIQLFGAHEPHLHGLRSLGTEHPVLQDVTPRQVRVMYINDNARYRREGSQIESTTIGMFNAVQEIYRKAPLMPKLSLAMAGQLTFIDRDPYSANTKNGEVLVFGANGLLDEWNDYRTRMASRLPVHDHGQLLSALNFEGAISGLAGVGTLCQPSISGSITQLTYGQLSNVVIMAHELGHGLGMSHDGRGNTCPSTGYIMQPYIGSSLDFSSCSLSAASSFVQSSGKNCLPLAPAAVESGPSLPAVDKKKLDEAKEVAKSLASRAKEHIPAIVGTTLGIPLGTYLLWRIVKSKGLPRPAIPSFLKRVFRRRDAEDESTSTDKTEKHVPVRKEKVHHPKYEVAEQYVPGEAADEGEQVEPYEPHPATPTARVTRSATAAAQQQPHKFSELPSTPPTATRSSYARAVSGISPGSAAAGGRPLATVANRRAKDALEDEDEDLQVWEGDDIQTSTKPLQTSEPRTTATKWLDAR